LLLGLAFVVCCAATAREFNVRDFGAKGDGVTLDSPAINAAIDAAASAGGGTVVLPPGRYLSFSIRLKSHLTLQLDTGAVLVAADPAAGLGKYDLPEANDAGDKLQYQDFGHSHWQNSLIWGIDLNDVTIRGAGLIDGTKGLVRNAGYPRREGGPNGTAPVASPGATSPPAALGGGAGGAPAPGMNYQPRNPAGLGNKAIALKNCRGVVIRDISILLAGHFGVLATGVDGLTLKNLNVDTNRDGFDIDACRNVEVSRCRVNAPNDDAIVLKTSLALGVARPTENVRITDCTVSGFDAGSVFAGTRLRTMDHAPDRDGPTGRIKIGTETDGAFRHILIADCVFERSRGLALETVDGGAIEDVTVRNLTMRDIAGPPIFLRLGNRARGPAGTPVGSMRAITISRVTADGADARYGAILIVGLPGHPIEQVTLRDIRIVSRGGLTPELVAQQPAAMINTFFLRGADAGPTGPHDPLAVPLREKVYPEPSIFGLIPAGAIYVRDARNLTMRNVAVSFSQPDTRPRVVLDSVTGAHLAQVDVTPAAGRASWLLRAVGDFDLARSPGVADVHHGPAGDFSF
jgi:polygalacturonase